MVSSIFSTSLTLLPFLRLIGYNDINQLPGYRKQVSFREYEKVAVAPA